jgi:hypothetical protein
MKLLKILSAILFSVFLLFLFRNLLLHFTYNHYTDQKEIVFESISDSEKQKWRFELETHYNETDELHITEYILSTDSTGIATYRRFKEKIFGVESSRLYSWSSLLPYDKEEYIDSDTTEIKVDESSILHLKSLPPFYDGSFIANYEMEDEKLVITSYIEVNDPKDYENSIPQNQSQVIPFRRLVPFFSWLYLRIKQGPPPGPPFPAN